MPLHVILSSYQTIRHPRPNFAPKSWGNIKAGLEEQAEALAALCELRHSTPRRPHRDHKKVRRPFVDVSLARRRRLMQEAVLRQTAISAEASSYDSEYANQFGHVLAQSGAYDDLSLETSLDFPCPQLSRNHRNPLPEQFHHNKHFSPESSPRLMYHCPPFARRRSYDPLSAETSPEIPSQEVTYGLDDDRFKEFLRHCYQSPDSSPDSSPEIPSPSDTPPEIPAQHFQPHDDHYRWSSAYYSGDERISNPRESKTQPIWCDRSPWGKTVAKAILGATQLSGSRSKHYLKACQEL